MFWGLASIWLPSPNNQTANMFAPTMSVHKVGPRLLELLDKLPASGSRRFAVVVKKFVSVYFVFVACASLHVWCGGGGNIAGSIGADSTEDA